jgi:hypothetical protein
MAAASRTASRLIVVTRPGATMSSDGNLFILCGLVLVLLPQIIAAPKARAQEKELDQLRPGSRPAPAGNWGDPGLTGGRTATREATPRNDCEKEESLMKRWCPAAFALLLVASPVSAQTTKALDLVPEDALGFVMVKNLRQLSDGVEALANKLKVKERVSLLELIQKELGIHEGGGHRPRLGRGRGEIPRV